MDACDYLRWLAPLPVRLGGGRRERRRVKGDDDLVAARARGLPVRDDAAHAGQFETVRARYAVGCDGARSQVRRAIGQQLVGDFANVAWGVMDMLAVTDFPDVRHKAAIQAAVKAAGE